MFGRGTEHTYLVSNTHITAGLTCLAQVVIEAGGELTTGLAIVCCRSIVSSDGVLAVELL